jgi:hypothetical protein
LIVFGLDNGVHLSHSRPEWAYLNIAGNTAIAAGYAVEIATGEAKEDEQAAQASLLRDIVGKLPPIDPAVLTWNDGGIVKLATSIYGERSLPEVTLDPARLAVLADALEEAGCTDTAILGHLRGPGPHVRGCWAVDLLLGKE